MGKKSTQFIAAAVAALAFGGAMAQEHHDKHMHHHHFPKDIDAFHSVLAPVWHASPGRERTRKACAKAREMAGLAKAIGSGDASALQAAVAGLQAKCKARPAEVDGALHEVHEAFHGLIDGGKHH